MQIIHFKKFCVPVSTGTSKVDKLLSDSISEGVIFQNFLGGACPQTCLVLACFACLCASHTMSVNMPASPTSTMMTGLVVPPPPFQKSRSAPVFGGSFIHKSSSRAFSYKVVPRNFNATVVFNNFIACQSLLCISRENSWPLAIFRPIFPIWLSKSNLLGQIYCTFPIEKLFIVYSNFPTFKEWP